MHFGLKKHTCLFVVSFGEGGRGWGLSSNLKRLKPPTKMETLKTVSKVEIFIYVSFFSADG